MGIAGTSTVPAAITLSGLPTGISVTSFPATVLPGASVTLTFTASLNADAGAFPATDPSNANSVSTSATISAVAGSVTATAPLTVVVSLSNAAFSPAAGQIDLPILNINTNNVPIVTKTTDLPATISITSADGSTTYLPGASDSDNTATFHVHGSTTASMPKLPYEMKLGTSVDLLNLLGVKCGCVTILGETVWPNPSAQSSYPESVTAFTDWVNQRIGYLDSVLNGQTATSAAIISGPIAATKGDSITYRIHVQSADGIPSGSVKLFVSGRAAGVADLDAIGDATITIIAPTIGNLYPLAVYEGDRYHAIAQASLRSSAVITAPHINP